MAQSNGLRWLRSAIASLVPDSTFTERWQEITNLWEFTTLRRDLQATHRTIRPWEFADNHNPIADTTWATYVTTFIEEKMHDALGVNVDKWLDQPPFKCNRDISLVKLSNQKRLDSLPKIPLPDNKGDALATMLDELKE